MKAPATVTIERWNYPIYGDRFSAMYEGRSLATRGTELEIRRYCCEMGWTVVQAEPAPWEGEVGPDERAYLDEMHPPAETDGPAHDGAEGEGS